MKPKSKLPCYKVRFNLSKETLWKPKPRQDFISNCLGYVKVDEQMFHRLFTSQANKTSADNNPLSTT